MYIQILYLIFVNTSYTLVLKYRIFLLIYQKVGMPKTKLLNIRIDPDLKKRAKKLAEADGRSLSNWVTSLISSKVKEAEKAEKLEKSQKSKNKD